MNLEELTEKAIQIIPKQKQPLGYGTDGTVHVIDDNVVLKVYNSRKFYHPSSQKCAEYELGIGKELHAQGAQVPEYFGLFKPVSKIPKLIYWGVFMERLYGRRTDSFFFRISGFRKEAERQYKEQEELIDRLGYYINDNRFDHNTLFDPKRRKLFLFDFLKWKRKSDYCAYPGLYPRKYYKPA